MENSSELGVGLDLTETFVPEILEVGLATKADSVLAATSSFAHAETVGSASTMFSDSFDGEKVTGHSSLSVSTFLDTSVFQGLVFLLHGYCHDGGYSHKEKSDKKIDLHHFG